MPAERELIVIAKADAGLRATAEGLATAGAGDAAPLADLLVAEGARIQPLFGASESRLKAAVAAAPGTPGAEMPDLSVYYRVEAPEEKMDRLAAKLRTMDVVQAAYVKPPAEPPLAPPGGGMAPLEVVEARPARPGAREPAMINDMAPLAEEPPTHTPDFSARQIYLGAAPAGVDARYAWTLPGGGGAGVRIIDIEGAWRFTHEDLVQNQGGVIGGTPTTDLGWRNHGTAVVGEFGADRNAFGATGICPDANVRAVSIFGGTGSAGAIRQAADALGPGDVILIELHRPGPRFNFQNRADQRGYIAVEWWPDDFDAIRYAVAKGVIVVEAAGNGAEDLDAGIYDTRPAGFPAAWANPFRRGARDSGAVLVGAGAPPPGTHGRDHGPDRSRLDFSNYGAALDAQGWGREVTTTGYGDLQGGTNENEWYTDRFSGTSSASPIVVGALGALQGALRARGRVPLSPARSRELLRATGSPQQDAVGRPRTQRIGNRPNLRALLGRALETRTWVGVQFRGTLAAGQTRRWFTYNWPAHWHVVWTVVPTTPRPGAPQLKWKVQVERASDGMITYWISVTNVSGGSCDFEARYAVLGW